MNPRLLFLVSASFVALLEIPAAPLGTAFTYQGRLTDGGAPAEGTYDLRFILYDADVGGNQIGGIVTKEDVAVAEGLLSVELDFGANAFPGDARWLDISVRAGPSAGVFTPLAPRQKVMPAPHAIYAVAAGSATSATTATRATTADTATTATSATTAVSATKATAADSAPWSGLTGVPAGFADGVDNDTTYTAGAGLLLDAGQFSVNFGSSGSAPVAARADHDHAGSYAAAGHAHSASDLTSGTVAEERLPNTLARLNGLQTFTGEVRIRSASDSLKPLTVQAAPGQFENLQEWQNETGQPVAWLRASGLLKAAGFSGDGSALTRISDLAPAVVTASHLADGQVVKSLNDLRDAVTLVAGPNVALKTSGNAIEISSTGGTEGWRLEGNAGTDPNLQFIGTSDNQPLEFRVNNVRVLRLESQVDVKGAQAFSFLGAPGANTMEGSGMIGGGELNAIRSSTRFGFVGGGRNNEIKESADYAFLGAGTLNAIGARASEAVLGGGSGNVIGAEARSAFLGGGSGNSIADQAFAAAIPGGSGNHAAGDFSFAAGRRAVALHDGAFVWGDHTDAEVASTAEDQFVVRAKGGLRFVDTPGVTLETGQGQLLNLTGASYGVGVQFATLYQRAVDNFAWFRGGAHADATFDTGNGGEVLMTLNFAGTLSVASVNQTSDRNRKTDFQPVNPGDFLERVSRLPVHTWRYTNDLPGVRHVGPVAQDFHAAFGVGSDDTHINVVDLGGVALAALQGLHQVAREQAEEIAALKAQKASLEARLSRLEALVAGQIAHQASDTATQLGGAESVAAESVAQRRAALPACPAGRNSSAQAGEAGGPPRFSGALSFVPASPPADLPLSGNRFD
jgi:hypothetical protein